jgi:hypothetical protein
LRSFELVLQYLRATTTQTGLKVRAHLASATYCTGVKVAQAEMQLLNIEQHTVCLQWNYTLRPWSSPAAVLTHIRSSTSFMNDTAYY